jgi:hypothetical protein
MPSIRSSISIYLLQFNYCAKTTLLILVFSIFIGPYSHYAKEGLPYIVIAVPTNRQPTSCTKCTKLNIQSSCNIYLVSNTKYKCLMRLYTF